MNITFYDHATSHEPCPLFCYQTWLHAPLGIKYLSGFASSQALNFGINMSYNVLGS